MNRFCQGMGVSSILVLIMSGHSKWSTIKRAKGVKDAARGKLFSKLSRQITIAVKEGGGPDPDANARLRLAIDTARAANMPKDNIERAINKSSGEGVTLTEVLYEGFGPGGVAVMIHVTTDNKNRTAQEINNMLEHSGGSLAGPNAVAFNFISRGYLFIEKKGSMDDMLLSLIDLGVEDYQEDPDGVELFTEPQLLFQTKQALEANGFIVKESSLIKKPTTTVELSEKDSEKLLNLVEQLEDHDDVDSVFVNAA